MNNQTRNYFPISSRDIAPFLYISEINTRSVLKVLHQVTHNLIKSFEFSANQVLGHSRAIFFILKAGKKKNPSSTKQHTKSPEFD